MIDSPYALTWIYVSSNNSKALKSNVGHYKNSWQTYCAVLEQLFGTEPHWIDQNGILCRSVSNCFFKVFAGLRPVSKIYIKDVLKQNNISSRRHHNSA